MPRSRLSYGLITSRNQGGGNKKQGLPPTMGLGPFSMNLIQRRAGYCKCRAIYKKIAFKLPDGNAGAGAYGFSPDGTKICGYYKDSSLNIKPIVWEFNGNILTQICI